MLADMTMNELVFKFTDTHAEMREQEQFMEYITETIDLDDSIDIDYEWLIYAQVISMMQAINEELSMRRKNGYDRPVQDYWDWTAI